MTLPHIDCEACDTLRNEVARVTVQLEVEKLKVAELGADLASETKQHGECVTDFFAAKARVAEVERDRFAAEVKVQEWIGATSSARAEVERLRAALTGTATITFTDGRAPCFCAQVDGWGNLEEPDTHEGYCKRARAALSPQEGGTP